MVGAVGFNGPRGEKVSTLIARSFRGVGDFRRKVPKKKTSMEMPGTGFM